MKGNLYANPTFLRRNIKQPSVIMIRPLVAIDEHRLYFNNISIKWEAKGIVNCTYSFHYKVLLVLADDFKVHVYNENLELITRLNNWQPKYIVGFKLIQELNMLLLIGTEQIEALKVNIVTNIKKTKFLSSMKFSIKKEHYLTVQKNALLKWNKGYGFHIADDLLYVWSILDIHFYSLQKLTLKSRVDNLAKKQNAIITVYFSSYYKYTIVGLANGDVRVWRLSVSQHYPHKETLIHNFTYHSRQVEQIIQGSDEKSIITYSLDLYVCFMSLETFQLLRIFNFAGDYTKIFLYDHISSYAIKDSFLGELKYGEKLEFITDITGTPIFHDRLSDLTSQQQNGSKIQITLSSNMGLQIPIRQIQTAKQLNKIDINNIYPPLKSKNIMQIVACPFYGATYYLIVEDGDIFRVKIQNNMGKIDHHYIISKACDSEKHLLHQNPNIIAFMHIVPPEIDTQIIEKTADKYFTNNYQQKITLYQTKKLLTIGCNRGSIVFISIDDMERIYARVSYHRQRIINLKEVMNKNSHQEWLVSVCDQRYLKITNFIGNRANCLCTVFLGQLYVNMHSFEQNIAIIFPKGIFQICKFTTGTQQPKILLNRESINHEEEIVAFDYRNDLKLILTGGRDNRIKIWTVCKILIYEIFIDELLNYCTWSTKMNILVVQASKIYCLKNVPLLITREEVERYNSQYLQNSYSDDEIMISEYFEKSLIREKHKQVKNRYDKPRLNQSVQETPQKIMDKKRKFLSPISEKKHFNKSTVLEKKSPKINERRTSLKTEGNGETLQRQDSDIEAVRRHILQLSSLKKVTNQSVLPKIQPKNQDIFVEFMREKLLNKKLLTRRDITLNRIIMKNLIKDHMGNDSEIIKSFKLE